METAKHMSKSRILSLSFSWEDGMPAAAISCRISNWNVAPCLSVSWYSKLSSISLWHSSPRMCSNDLSSSVKEACTGSAGPCVYKALFLYQDFVQPCSCILLYISMKWQSIGLQKMQLRCRMYKLQQLVHRCSQSFLHILFCSIATTNLACKLQSSSTSHTFNGIDQYIGKVKYAMLIDCTLTDCTPVWSFCF